MHANVDAQDLRARQENSILEIVLAGGVHLCYLKILANRYLIIKLLKFAKLFERDK